MKDQLEALIAQLVERGIRFPIAMKEFEKKYIDRVLERTHGNQSQAARILGMHRNTLSRKMEEHKLSVNGHVSNNGNARGPR